MTANSNPSPLNQVQDGEQVLKKDLSEISVDKDTAQKQNPADFDENLIKKYPRSNRKINVEVQTYTLISDTNLELKSLTSYISPYGMEFQTTRNYSPGTLLKILVSLPDYWSRKQRYVNYNRIDTPNTFKVLAKVVKTEDIGKRGKKKIILVQTVNMDEVDEQVLKSYLQDG
jgi:hypothetical protein